MQDRHFKKYPPLNLNSVTEVQYSQLYSLAPIGIGTPLIESLTSYIARLALAHCVYPGILMERVVKLVLNKRYSSAEIHKIYNSISAINGSGIMGLDTINALSQLTLQPKLYLLNLTSLSPFMPSRNLLHEYRFWCPQCYQDWKVNHQRIYEPLMWKLKSVIICNKHYITLQDQCPHCHKKNYHLSWKTRPGYCSECYQWLGEVGLYNFKTNQEINSDFNWHLWVAKNLGEVLAKNSLCQTTLSPDQVSKSLMIYIQNKTNGNISAFARLLKIPRNTLWVWCKGNNQPSLEMLLRICYCLNISVWNFLREKHLLEQEITNFTNLPTQLKTKAKSRIIDKEKLKKNLEEVLRKKTTPPHSMEQVAKELKISRRTIYTYFPELCSNISAKYLEYRKITQQKNIDTICQEVRQIVYDLHSKGIFPSEQRVLKRISKPGFLRYEAVKQSFFKARNELGL